MASHKEFDNAGKSPGVEIWRIEKMDLRPVPKALYGEFFSGDAYIVLHTSPFYSYNVHLWKGKQATQDETGAGAIFMTQMDDHFGGSPKQFTEYQENESATFMGYFKGGIRYKKGGHASGFNHVTSNEEHPDFVLHVKGRRNIRGTETSMSWESFNSGDCFLIFLGEIIYHWSGSKSNFLERLKATELAIALRDNEARGRCKIEMISEGEEPQELIDLLGPKPDLPEGTCDRAADEKNSSVVSLLQISDAAGSMKTTLVSDKNPFQQGMLSQSECYILDNGPNNVIYVWKGKDANPDERKAAFSAATKFIKDKGYSKKTQIVVCPSKGESTEFKQFFPNWLDQYETTGPTKAYTINKIAKVPFDAAMVLKNNTMAAQHGMLDDGSGKIQIWRIENDDKAPVDESLYGQFYGGDCYLVLYTGKDVFVIYIWQGLQCSQHELGASAILAVQLDDSECKDYTQIRVTQGKEPPHFVSLFKDKPMVINLGGTSRDGGDSKPGDTRLFRIRQSSSNFTWAVEVEPIHSRLNTNDVFLLKTPQRGLIWKGKESTEEELATAKRLATHLKCTASEVGEGSEPADFWKSLGGKGDYQTTKIQRDENKQPQLFGCSNKTGRLVGERVPGEFTQMDLATDDVMLLDTWDQIFLWIGKDANAIEKDGVVKFVKEEYLVSSGRSGIPITTIKQGKEPLSFIGWFPHWDHKLWCKDGNDRLQTLLKK